MHDMHVSNKLWVDNNYKDKGAKQKVEERSRVEMKFGKHDRKSASPHHFS